MDSLVPCSRCNRHVREETCPFCGASIVEARSSALARASRAAIFALAATPGLVACHQVTVEVYGGPPPPMTAPEAAAPSPSASTSASSAPVAAPETAHVTAYGGPPTATVAPPIVPAPKP
ncbi:MAG TPA: hypothetical protein VGH28_06195 [Polyangiaceae bacterium]